MIMNEPQATHDIVIEVFRPHTMYIYCAFVGSHTDLQEKAVKYGLLRHNEDGLLKALYGDYSLIVAPNFAMSEVAEYLAGENGKVIYRDYKK